MFSDFVAPSAIFLLSAQRRITAEFKKKYFRKKFPLVCGPLQALLPTDHCGCCRTRNKDNDKFVVERRVYKHSSDV